MPYLVLTTIIWAFSFPLIGYFISGQMDSFFAAFFRVFLAFLVFLPMLDFTIQNALKFKLFAIGALQIGIMYIFYYNSFAYLSVAEVALWTIFTPFYVSLIYDLFAGRFRALYLCSIALCVFGAGVIKYSGVNADFWKGFLLVQGANIAFGAGQSLYKVVIEKHKNLAQKSIFGYFHFGAMVVTGTAFVALGDKDFLPQNLASWAVLIYLGVVSSGVGYLWWNKGAVAVDAGFLALMNNALIPAAILVDLLFYFGGFGGANLFESNALWRVIFGIFLMALSLVIHKKIIDYYEK
ncbi:EamA family transporter [Helicobacter sp. 23-1044]